MIFSNINGLNWPPVTPDINIAEDVWNFCLMPIMTKPPYENKVFLLEKIDNVKACINHAKKKVMQRTTYGNKIKTLQSYFM